MGNGVDMNNLEEVARPLLPVFFVLDTSGSMDGQPISVLNHAMEETLHMIEDFARKNADALVKIGVLSFDSGVSWMQPGGLEELGDFMYEPLTAGGLTALGAALRELDEKLSRHTFLASTTGWCKSIIIFMTDGMPNDEWEEALRMIENNKWYQHAIKIGFGVGDHAEMSVLSQVVGDSEAVLQTTNLEVFGKMLQKVAVNSVMIGSKSRLTEDTMTGRSIVRSAMEEEGNLTDVKTGKDMGIHVELAEPQPNWGSDTWK